MRSVATAPTRVSPGIPPRRPAAAPRPSRFPSSDELPRGLRHPHRGNRRSPSYALLPGRPRRRPARRSRFDAPPARRKPLSRSVVRAIRMQKSGQILLKPSGNGLGPIGTPTQAMAKDSARPHSCQVGMPTWQHARGDHGRVRRRRQLVTPADPQRPELAHRITTAGLSGGCPASPLRPWFRPGWRAASGRR